jgi:hypothetical protein
VVERKRSSCLLLPAGGHSVQRSPPPTR